MNVVCSKQKSGPIERAVGRAVVGCLRLAFQVSDGGKLGKTWN